MNRAPASRPSTSPPWSANLVTIRPDGSGMTDRNGQNFRLLARLGKGKPRTIDWGTAR